MTSVRQGPAHNGLFTLIVAFLMLTCVICPIPLNQTYTFTMAYRGNATYGYEFVPFNFNYDSIKHKVGPAVNVRPDVTMDDIGLGKKDTVGWGVDCTQSVVKNSSTNCFEYSFGFSEFYQNHSFHFNPSKTYWALVNQVDIGQPDIQFGLILAPPSGDWFMQDVGIFGLAPPSSNGVMYKYVFSQYQVNNMYLNYPAFTFSLLYNLNLPANKFTGGYNDTWAGSVLYMNGYPSNLVDTTKPTAHILQTAKDGTQHHWTIYSLSIQVNGKTVVQAGDTCLNNVANSMFSLPEATRGNFIVAVNNAICGKSVCPYGQGSTPSVTINFRDSEMQQFSLALSPGDYLYDDQGNVGASVDYLEGWKIRSSEACGKEHTIGLGRLFFYKYLLYFTSINKKSSLEGHLFISQFKSGGQKAEEKGGSESLRRETE